MKSALIRIATFCSILVLGIHPCNRIAADGDQIALEGPEGVEAVFEKGVLEITLPRAEADKPRKIAIKAG